MYCVEGPLVGLSLEIEGNDAECIDKYHGGDVNTPVDPSKCLAYVEDCKKYCKECQCTEPNDFYCNSFLDSCQQSDKYISGGSTEICVEVVSRGQGEDNTDCVSSCATVQTKDGAHSYAHWDMGSADRPRGSGFGVVEFDADTLQEVNEQFFYSQVVTECPQAGGQYEHQSGTHGDVCRNPGAPWDCPTGCSITSGRQAPYCLVRMPPGVADKLCRQTSVDEAGNGDQDISVMASYLAGIPSGRPVAITRAPEVVVGAYSTYAVAINAALQSMGIDGPPESTQVARECLQAGARYEHQDG